MRQIQDFDLEFIFFQKKRIKERIESAKKIVYDDVTASVHAQLKAYAVIPASYRALQQIQDGTYGICTECGEKIPRKRLEIMPAAIRCVDCQRSSDTLSF